MGKRVSLKDAYEKATGSLKYAVDISSPEMLYGSILRSPHAHARITRIDTTKAESLPGVKAVVTHKDVPHKREWVGVWVNSSRKVLDDTVRYVGDEVAAVAAVDRETAEHALGLIDVDFEVLPAVFDPEEAMKPSSPLVRKDGNVRKPSIIEWGNVEDAFRKADIVVEHICRIGSQEPAPLGRNAYVANWSRDGVSFTTSTQTPSHLRDIIANYFDLPMNQVHVMGLPTGPSFGTWWVNNVDLVTVLLARKAKRPVKVELSLEESFNVKRRHIEMTQARLGVTKEGVFNSIWLRHVFDNGAYGDKRDVYQSVADLWGGSCPNGRFEQYGVATNLLTAGCLRGVGDMTMNFCMEQIIDKAAEKLGMDPVDIRLKNHVRDGDPLRCPSASYALFPKITPPEHTLLSTSRLGECLKAGAKAIGWSEKWKGWRMPIRTEGTKFRGVGCATACHICGLNWGGSTSAVVTVNPDATSTLHVNVGRQGQSSETTQAQIVAEELGIPYECVVVVSGDTDACPWGQGSTASTTAYLTGLATKAAAADAKHQILELAAKFFEAQPQSLEISYTRVHRKDKPEEGIPLTEILTRPVEQFLAPPIIVGRASENVTNDIASRHFAAHFVELEVDGGTGQIKILRYVAAHDSGTIINPGVCENQVAGGILLGAGLALSEQLLFDPQNGSIRNPNFLDYKVLGSLDMPDPEIIFIQDPDPTGPFGAKGIGEVPACPPAPAIAQAVYNAIGVRVDLPMTPEKILGALGKLD